MITYMTEAITPRFFEKTDTYIREQFSLDKSGSTTISLSTVFRSGTANVITTAKIPTG